MVLLHGLTDSGECWADAVARWQDRFRIVAPDALGHGSSRRFTVDELGNDPMSLMYAATLEVVAQVSQDGGRSTVLVGHSMGGGIAAAVASRRPDLVRAVVLEDPAWFAPEPLERRRASAVTNVARCQRIRDDVAAAVAEGGVRHPRWHPEEVAAWARAKAQCDLGFLATGLTALATPWTDMAAALAVPTLVVTGTDDVIVDAPTRETITRLGNPLLEVEVIEGASHNVRRDRPEEFHTRVDPWLLRQLAARGRETTGDGDAGRRGDTEDVEYLQPQQRLDGPVVLVEPKPEWPSRYAVQEARVRGALGPAALRVEHVGSTSVPGLAAKDVIDIALEVQDASDEPAWLPALQAAGYVLHLREPGWEQHRLLRRARPAVHLHVFTAGSKEVERMLLFRDRLRANRDDLERYERTKRELARRRWAHRQDYADAKSAVVEQIIATARAESRGS